MIERFLEYIAVEKKYSENTVLSYRRDLHDFSEFLLRTESHQDFSEVDKKIVRNFISSLGENKVAKRSINRKLSSLRSFYRFMMQLGEVSASPLAQIQTLKFYAEPHSPFSVEEMENLTDEAHKPIKKDALKELIIETLYQTGMRRAELTGLLIENVDFENLQLKITGKGNKQRIVPFSNDLAARLEQYLESRRPSTGNEGYFFVSAKGRKVNDKFVYSAVKSYLSLVTSKPKKSPHMLRHSFATHLLEGGAEISKVKVLMGHSSLASTQVYTSANIEQLKKVFNQAHPRAIEKSKDI